MFGLDTWIQTLGTAGQARQRNAAARRLGCVPCTVAASALVAALEDPTIERQEFHAYGQRRAHGVPVRQSALDALGRMGPWAIVPLRDAVAAQHPGACSALPGFIRTQPVAVLAQLSAADRSSLRAQLRHQVHTPTSPFFFSSADCAHAISQLQAFGDAPATTCTPASAALEALRQTLQGGDLSQAQTDSFDLSLLSGIDSHEPKAVLDLLMTRLHSEDTRVPEAIWALHVAHTFSPAKVLLFGLTHYSKVASLQLAAAVCLWSQTQDQAAARVVGELATDQRHPPGLRRRAQHYIRTRQIPL